MGDGTSRCRLWTGVFVALAIAVFAVSGTVKAEAPPGEGLQQIPFTCNGKEVVLTVSQGAAHWVDDEHGVLTSLTITFTPTGGTPRVIFSKTYGNRNGLTDEPVACTGTVAVPNGTLSFDGTSVAVP